MIDSLLQIVLELPLDSRKPAISTIVVYDSTKCTTNPAIQSELIQECKVRVEQDPSYQSLKNCIDFINGFDGSYEYLYWKGYQVCNLCGIRDEVVLAREYQEGKRWRDPFVGV